MCALEVGRPIVRATNTGISALIGADGSVQAQTALWEAAILRGVLPVAPMRWTPYARWGELMLALWVGAACAAVLAAWGIRRDGGRRAIPVREPVPPPLVSAPASAERR
jgi:apolipoprotein N-acyltransferase